METSPVNARGGRLRLGVVGAVWAATATAATTPLPSPDVPAPWWSVGRESDGEDGCGGGEELLAATSLDEAPSQSGGLSVPVHGRGGDDEDDNCVLKALKPTPVSPDTATCFDEVWMDARIARRLGLPQPPGFPRETRLRRALDRARPLHDINRAVVTRDAAAALRWVCERFVSDDDHDHDHDDDDHDEQQPRRSRRLNLKRRQTSSRTRANKPTLDGRLLNALARSSCSRGDWRTLAVLLSASRHAERADDDRRHRTNVHDEDQDDDDDDDDDNEDDTSSDDDDDDDDDAFATPTTTRLDSRFVVDAGANVAALGTTASTHAVADHTICWALGANRAAAGPYSLPDVLSDPLTHVEDMIEVDDVVSLALAVVVLESRGECVSASRLWEQPTTMQVPPAIPETTAARGAAGERQWSVPCGASRAEFGCYSVSADDYDTPPQPASSACSPPLSPRFLTDPARRLLVRGALNARTCSVREYAAAVDAVTCGLFLNEMASGRLRPRASGGGAPSSSSF